MSPKLLLLKGFAFVQQYQIMLTKPLSLTTVQLRSASKTPTGDSILRSTLHCTVVSNDLETRFGMRRNQRRHHLEAYLAAAI